MPGSHRPRSLARTLLVAVSAAAALGGCQPSASASVGPTPRSSAGSAAPGATAAVTDGGTITLTDDDCTWAANPGSMSEGRLTVAVQNGTDHHGVFILHKLFASRTFGEGQAAIAAIQDALRTGAEWPAEVSDVVTEGTAEAGRDGQISIITSAGTYGVVCSASPSPTGDILTVFLVGPLEVTRQ